MNNIFVKVAPNGEGKTEWLLDNAKRELDNNKKVVFVSSIDANRYVKFAEYYRVKYNVPCPVTFSNRLDTIDSDTVVLIDNLFKQDLNTMAMTALFNRGCCVYLTICGNAE